jgi:hypothetical protein
MGILLSLIIIVAVVVVAIWLIGQTSLDPKSQGLIRTLIVLAALAALILLLMGKLPAVV